MLCRNKRWSSASCVVDFIERSLGCLESASISYCARLQVQDVMWAKFLIATLTWT